MRTADSELYREAGVLYCKVAAGACNLKRGLFESHFSSDVRKLLAVVAETIKNKALVGELAARAGVVRDPRAGKGHRKESRDARECSDGTGCQRCTALVQVYDMVFGHAGGNTSGCPLVGKSRQLRDALDLMIKEAKVTTKEELQALYRQGDKTLDLPVYVRVNTALISRQDAVRHFQDTGFTFTDPGSKAPAGLRYNQFLERVAALGPEEFMPDFHLVDCLLVFGAGVRGLHTDRLVQERMALIQDKASCIPAAVLAPELGWDVIDACAAPGNKTSQLLAMLIHEALTTDGETKATEPMEIDDEQNEFKIKEETSSKKAKKKKKNKKEKESVDQSVEKETSEAVDISCDKTKDDETIQEEVEESLKKETTKIHEEENLGNEEQSSQTDGKKKKKKKKKQNKESLEESQDTNETERKRLDKSDKTAEDQPEELLKLDKTGEQPLRSTVFAFDRDENRFRLLQDAVSRYRGLAGSTVTISERCQDFLQTDPHSEEFSRVRYICLDPSCSGSGIMRQIDRVAERSSHGLVDPQRLRSLRNFQAMLLGHALSFPSVHRVVYSTCSVTIDENEAVVQEIADKYSGEFELRPVWPDRWMTRGKKQLQQCIRTNPSYDLCNGFFVACFERVGPAGSADATRVVPSTNANESRGTRPLKQSSYKPKQHNHQQNQEQEQEQKKKWKKRKKSHKTGKKAKENLKRMLLEGNVRKDEETGEEKSQKPANTESHKRKPLGDGDREGQGAKKRKFVKE